MFTRAVSRNVSRIASTRPLVSLARPLAPIRFANQSLFAQFRNYSDHPEPLTPQLIEDRVMQLLKDFDKVEAVKVSPPYTGHTT
jgi:hypothetical protein